MSTLSDEVHPPPYPDRPGEYDADTFRRLELPLRDVEFWMRQITLETGASITLNAHGLPRRTLRRIDSGIHRFLEVRASESGYHIAGGVFFDTPEGRLVCFREFGSWTALPNDSGIREALSAAWEQIQQLTIGDMARIA
jgi:hypothetical protein